MHPVGRFAPSPTGPAHLGTLLNALLSWLDARAVQGRFIVRYEDLDPQRSHRRWENDIRTAIQTLGIDWDAEIRQSECRAAHAEALEKLAAQGHLYACRCTRREIAQAGAATAADGGRIYPGTCRHERIQHPTRTDAVLRFALPENGITVAYEGESPQREYPRESLGDPVLRRRDGTAGYHLASVVDDGAAGVTRIVRGNDLRPCAGIQQILRAELQLPAPSVRHHLLLLEADGDKLAKLHDARGWQSLGLDGPGLCGQLAMLSGLRSSSAPCLPTDLLSDFDAARIQTRDIPARNFPV